MFPPSIVPSMQPRGDAPQPSSIPGMREENLGQRTIKASSMLIGTQNSPSQRK